MLEAAQIFDNIVTCFEPGLLVGVKLLLTAGPTREAIDPVRYITNRSSGKMGYAIAAAAQRAGAEVTLVSGPVSLTAPPGVKLLAVLSAQEMHDVVMQQAASTDLFIACAAVSDYRVDQVATQKIKKSAEAMSLQLQPNPDILTAVSAMQGRPFCVGFAAETNDLEKYARAKLEQKKLDMIVANQVGEGSGFEIDDNEVTVFWPQGQQKFDLASKTVIAKQLIDLIAGRYNQR